jgi:YD repeat-containing protein
MNFLQPSPDLGVVVQTNNRFGDPLSIADPLNRTTTFTYDGKQNVLTKTDPLGKTTTYTYDTNGNNGGERRWRSSFSICPENPMSHVSVARTECSRPAAALS